MIKIKKLILTVFAVISAALVCFGAAACDGDNTGGETAGGGEEITTGGITEKSEEEKLFDQIRTAYLAKVRKDGDPNIVDAEIKEVIGKCGGSVAVTLSNAYEEEVDVAAVIVPVTLNGIYICYLPDPSYSAIVYHDGEVYLTLPEAYDSGAITYSDVLSLAQDGDEVYGGISKKQALEITAAYLAEAGEETVSDKYFVEITAYLGTYGKSVVIMLRSGKEDEDVPAVVVPVEVNGFVVCYLPDPSYSAVVYSDGKIYLDLQEAYNSGALSDDAVNILARNAARN